MRIAVAIVALAVATSTASAPADERVVLKYHDGEPEGMKSLGSSGPMIHFEMPKGGAMPEGGGRLAGLRIHGARYGHPDPPEEQFLIFVQNEERTRIITTQMAPYRLFERGENQWVEVLFDEPLAAPDSFWIAVDFRARRTKGVYVSYDVATGGVHSRVGLPGLPVEETDFAGDWMMEVILAP